MTNDGIIFTSALGLFFSVFVFMILSNYIDIGKFGLRIIFKIIKIECEQESLIFNLYHNKNVPIYPSGTKRWVKVLYFPSFKIKYEIQSSEKYTMKRLSGDISYNKWKYK